MYSKSYEVGSGTGRGGKKKGKRWALDVQEVHLIWRFPQARTVSFSSQEKRLASLVGFVLLGGMSDTLF